MQDSACQPPGPALCCTGPAALSCSRSHFIPISPEFREGGLAPVTFDRTPEQYRHWKVSYDGRVATLAMDVAEDGGLKPGYKLKLNSYDLGVDIELYDALQRIRFEHPEVGCVVLTSAK